MKLTYYVLIGSILFCLLISCKKKNDLPKTSTEELVKGKAWSGDLKYISQWTEQPFYVAFNNNDNQFIWTETAGQYSGIYAIDESKHEVKMTFTTGAILSVVIDKDGKPGKITYGGAYGWSIQNIEPNSTADPLDNTNWKGTETPRTGPVNNNCTIAFKPATRASFNGLSAALYTRSGPMISFSMKGGYLYIYFLVINKNKIKGVQTTQYTNIPETKFELTKQ